MSEWVQTIEGLPSENQEEVIVSLEKENGEKLVTTLIFSDGEFGDEIYQGIPQEWVKAWMPLPENHHANLSLIRTTTGEGK